MITLHRTGTQHYETKIDGERWSVTQMGAGQWGVARNLTFVATVGGFREAHDLVESTVIAEQNTAQDEAVENGQLPCFNGECLAATGPDCVCGCGGAGHGMVYAGTMLMF